MTDQEQKTVERIKKWIIRPLGKIQLLLFALLPLSAIIFIWATWLIWIKALLTIMVIFIVASFFHVVFKQVIAELEVKEFKQELKTFSQKLEEKRKSNGK